MRALTPHLFVSEAARAEARASLAHLPRPLVFFCPEAGMKIKAWPPERFITLGRCLQEVYGAGLVVVGLGDAAAQVAAELGALSSDGRPAQTRRRAHLWRPH